MHTRHGPCLLAGDLLPECPVAARRPFVLLASLAALSLLSALSHPLSAQGIRNPGTVRPLCRTGCGGDGSPVSVTHSGSGPDSVISYGDTTQFEVWFTVHNTGGYADTYTLTMDCTTETCISETYTSVSLGAGESINVGVFFRPGAANTTGGVSLTAADAGCGGQNAPLQGPGPSLRMVDWAVLPTCYSSSDAWSIVNLAGPAPVISLLPYSPGVQPAGDGVVYQHGTSSVVSMGVERSLTLTYNSAAVRPMALIAVDVSNPYNAKAWYPNAYVLQVQRVDNGAYLTLMNSATSVYFTAASSYSYTTRLLAAIDGRANNLTTGAYAVNVIVSSIFSGGALRTVTSVSRILINDQSSSPYGAGVGLAGLPRLYSDQGSSYGALLVDGSGSSSYFARSCASCTFTSAEGESRTLDTLGGTAYRLTALDGSFFRFGTDGRAVDHYALPGIQDLTFTWTSGNLTSVTDATGRGFSLSYAGGVLTRIIDFASDTTSVLIASGRLVRVTDPDGLADSLSFDGNAMLTQVRNRAGDRTAFAYNVLNQADSVALPADTVYGASQPASPTTFTWTAALLAWQPAIAGTSQGTAKANIRADTLMARVKDPRGYVTRIAQDRFGQPVKVVDTLGQTTTILRDSLGNATALIEANGHRTVATYTGYLATTQNDSAAGEYRSFYYNASHRLVREDGGPVRTDFFYHDGSQGPAGTLQMAYAGSTNATPGGAPSGGDTLSYHIPDGYGRDTLVTDGLHHPTRWQYNSPANGGNLLRQIDANHDTTTYQYWATGRTSVTTMPNHVTTLTSHFDRLGRPDTVTDALGAPTVYHYGPRGLTRVSTAGGTYKFDLNAWGLVVARYDLADTTLADRFAYDSAGNVRRLLTRAGDSVTATYDGLGRALTRSGSNFPSQTFAYGLNSAWTVANNAYGRDSTTYDQMGRPTSTTQRMPNGSTSYQMSFTYDAHGRLISRTAPAAGSALSLYYNATLGVLDSVSALGVLTRFDSLRNANLNPTRIGYRLGTHPAWWRYLTRDSLEMVVRDTFSTGTGLNGDFATTWTYDRLGRATSAQTPLTGSLYPTYFTYDADGQLTNACQYAGSPYCRNEYGSIQQAYTYDWAGNRSETLAQPMLGLGNRMLRFKNYAFSYDRNGADTLKAGLGSSYPWTSTDTTRLGWNALGQLVRVEHWNAGAPTHTVDSLFYDALGRRVAWQVVNGATTWYVYDGDQIVLDVNPSTPSTPLAEYAYLGEANLLGIRTPSDTLIAITTPPNGTVVGMARAQDGVVVKRYPVLHAPWSQQVPDTGFGVRFRMGGQEFDQETGLYHLGARYYDPQLGRFLSEDPIGLAGGLNLYAYSNNDAINQRDPSGHEGCWVPYDSFVTYNDGKAIDSGVDWEWVTECGGSSGGFLPSPQDGGDTPAGTGDAAAGQESAYQPRPKPHKPATTERSCVEAGALFVSAFVFETGALLVGGAEAKEGLALVKLGLGTAASGGFAAIRAVIGTGLSRVLSRRLSAAGMSLAGGGLLMAAGGATALIAPHLAAEAAGDTAEGGFLHSLNPYGSSWDRYNDYLECLRAQTVEAN